MKNIKRIKSKKFKFKKATFIFFLSVILFFVLARIYFQPPVMVYAKQKSYLYASILINDAINDQIVPFIDTNKIITMETKSNGYVSSVVVDVFQVNLLLSKMTKQIQQELLNIEKNPASELNQLKIPLGVMFDNPLLYNMGPNIKVNLRIVGSVNTDIASSVKPYGINNTLIEVVIKTKVRFQVMIPFQKSTIEVVTNTPLLIKVVQGDIPHYYYTGGNGNFSNPPRDDSGGSTPDSTLLEQ